MSVICRICLCVCSFFSVVSYVSAEQAGVQLPTGTMYLWDEKPLVSPDREHVKEQLVRSVDNPSMTPYWPDAGKASGAAIVIFPGGGYEFLAINHEGHYIAKWFAERGVAAFVVKYRMKEYGFPAPLLDGLRAVRQVRKHAATWGIDPAKVGVIGFSAGGHLAASVTTRYDFEGSNDPLAEISARPDFSILVYPVITMKDPETHVGSRIALLGNKPDSQLVDENSLEKQVTAAVPPVFMLHGVGDQAVPVANSLAFFSEVQKHNKQSELHIYNTAYHGFGMIQGQETVASWPHSLELWLTSLQIIK